MKEGICSIIGLIGSFIASLFGGWDAALITLISFMAIDYITGLLVAGVFHKSQKTENGALAVSYTHLDVYKRQVRWYTRC